MKTQKNKKNLSLFDKIILALNIIAAVLLLFSYLAPTTDPRDSTTIALLGFGFIYLAVAK